MSNNKVYTVGYTYAGERYRVSQDYNTFAEAKAHMQELQDAGFRSYVIQVNTIRNRAKLATMRVA